MIKKLQKKFIAISVVAVASVMVLLFAAVNIANFVSTDTQLKNTLEMITDNHGQMPRAEPNEKPPKEKKELFGGMKGNDFTEETPFMTRYFVLRFDSDGNQIESDLSQIAAVTDADTDAFLSLAVGHGEGFGITSGYRYLVTAEEGGEYMAVFVNNEREVNAALTLFWVSLVATLACIALITAIIVVFSKRAMKPIAENNQKQKQFITDASHELKTPITVINTSLSVLEMEVGKQKWIDKAKAQCEKLRELVNSLVSLSRLDEEENPLHFETFAISETVEEIARSFEDFAAEKGHALELDITPGLKYCGDSYAVRQLCSVLLENAVKYASEGSAISFSLRKSKRDIIITTENECEDLDITQLDKLFDRFYRADKSRNSQTGGFGIGLSLARSICLAHKGSIGATSTDGKHITFTARLK